jgi:protein TonB
VSYATTVQRPRGPAIAAVVAIHGLLAYAFITGLAFTVVEQMTSDLKTFDVVQAAPPAEEPAPEPQASENPTPVDVSPSPVPTRANPLSSADVRGPSSTGGAMASSASLLRGAFNNETDYPSAARRAEQQGTVRVSYTVGTDGRVTGCAVVQSSGSSSLDSTTCRIFQRRFRYAPARDSAGNPVPQTMSQSVRWQLT